MTKKLKKKVTSANAQPLASQDITPMTTELPANHQPRETPFPSMTKTKGRYKYNPRF